jgi:hypothetical protein
MTANISETFLTSSDAARRLGRPVAQILRAVADGTLHPAGRCGTFQNSAVVWREGDLAVIEEVLAGRADRGGGGHTCASADEVRSKFDALRRARSEGSQ